MVHCVESETNIPATAHTFAINGIFFRAIYVDVYAI